MEYYILDRDFNILRGVEKFQSMIWTEKFYDIGDFELYLPATDDTVKFYNEAAKNHYYIVASKTATRETLSSLSAMIIEDVELDDSYKDGAYLIITGHQLKNILYRRIIWDRKTIAGQLYSEIAALVLENAVAPASTDRAIPRLYLDPTLEQESSDNLPAEYLKVVNYQVEGEFLSSALSAICKDNKIGYTITIDFIKKQMVFSLLIGKDRTSSQTELPRVMFSEEFDNLLKTTYRIDNSNYRNVALVKGTYQEYNDKTKEIEVKKIDQVVAPYKLASNPVGLDRYELYVEGDNGTLDDSTQEINVGVLESTNRSKGRMELEKYKSTTDISADVAPQITFQLNRDYFLGDLVSIRNEFDLIYDGRVTSITTTLTTKKSQTIPSFTVENYTGKEEEEKPEETEARITENRVYLYNDDDPSNPIIVTGPFYRTIEDGIVRRIGAGLKRSDRITEEVIYLYNPDNPSEPIILKGSQTRITEDEQTRECIRGSYDNTKYNN